MDGLPLKCLSFGLNGSPIPYIYTQIILGVNIHNVRVYLRNLNLMILFVIIKLHEVVFVGRKIPS